MQLGVRMLHLDTTEGVHDLGGSRTWRTLASLVEVARDVVRSEVQYEVANRVRLSKLVDSAVNCVSMRAGKADQLRVRYFR